MRILVVNAGSSSLKLSVVSDGRTIATDAGELSDFVAQSGEIDAVGHRVVHGGADLVAATRLDDDIERRIGALTPLAPLHQTAALDGIRAARSLLPEVPQFACFDTAFHATLAPAAATYALPAEWRSRWGLRRFGFHGLSHAYASRRAAELVGRPLGELRIVTAHLGAGASLCAVLEGRSVDTTMGFTPLEGLVMATRSGSIDPGLVIWLAQQGVPVDELGEALETRSGLAGLSGTSGDMREVLELSGRGDEQASLALDVYVHRLVREVAAMAASLGGLDALAFTGGVGEHAPDVRARAADGLGFLGVRLDTERNRDARADADVSVDDATVRTLVIEAREDLEIARQVERIC